jgi:hypothetical protein
MPADYQVLAFRDSAPISKVGLYSDSPLSLDIRGTNFAGVARVLINGEASPEFVVLTEKRILAEVPDSQKGSVIQSVRVLLARAGITSTTTIALEAVVPGSKAVGFTRLLQAFLRVLLTTPGEDFENRTLGGGLYRLVGAAGTPAELKGAAAQAVNTSEDQLIALQAANPYLDDSERLQSVTLLQAEYVPATTSLDLRFRLTAVDGTTGNPLVSV